ncbi:ABC transporter permease [Acetivibrio cellulolyticus]|uniref:ABC transporter permease n=1 Tax=Acetivibrio cellulolyticus TaxID=35830 RepID=UPI0001E2BDAA|nr:ABC transporter permease [Acetivibrio cellulolyticus]
MQKTGVETIELNRNQKFERTILNKTISKKKYFFSTDSLLLSFAAIAVLIYFTLIILPIFSLLKVTGVVSLIEAITCTENIFALKLSFLTTLVSLFLTFIFGTPVVYYLSCTKNNFFKKVSGIIVSLPSVLPPAVAGIGLLLSFGRNGMLGMFLAKFNIEVVFTPTAVILAQFFVSSTFYIQVLKNGVDGVCPEIYEASYVFGAGKAETFFRVIIPMLKKNVIAGLVVSWTRALGEFGATIMFAGNVFCKTRTMPLQIYTLMQTDIKLAASVSVVLFIISFVMLWTVNSLLKDEV